MSRRTFSKPPLTFAEQVDLLLCRGMSVADRHAAEQSLARLNYYRLSGYWHPFKNHDNTFRQGCSLDVAIRLYEYDRRLRLLVLDAIERVEVHLRTAIAYHLARTHGAFSHEDPSRFEPRFTARFIDIRTKKETSLYQGWLEKVHEETERSREVFVNHYRASYSGFPTLPVWMVVELASFGTLSKLFEHVLRPDRSAIAAEFGVTERLLVSWLHTLSYVRNVCAHHSRLWNRELAIKPQTPKSKPTALVDNFPSNGRVYAVILILRQLTLDHRRAEDWKESVIAFILDGVSDGIPISSMGVPENWMEHPLWNG